MSDITLIYNDVYQHLYGNTDRYLPIKGSAGSGKSVFAAQKVIIRVRHEQGHNILAVRKVGRTIKNSIFALLKNNISKLGLSKEFKINNTDFSFLHKSTGNQIITSGLDEVDKLKSITDITSTWVEEATDLEEYDFDQLDLRLRGQTKNYKQHILTFNPVSKNHWMYKRFGHMCYSTTYKDNYFLDDQDRQTIENLANIDENLHRIYALGEWGIEDPNKLFAKNFKPEKHVTHLHWTELYNPYLSVHLCFDFNVASTCLAIQHTEEHIVVLKEYHYHGVDLEGLCKEAASDFPDATILINGDASGWGRTTTLQTQYDIVYNALNFYTWDNFNVPKANPTHLDSRTHCNLVFKLLNLQIQAECVELIKDLQDVLVDDRGSMDPYKKKNPNRSHWLDPFRYFVYAEVQHVKELIRVKNAA